MLSFYGSNTFDFEKQLAAASIKGAQSIPQAVGEISHHICGSKKIPTSEIQVGNHGKHQKLVIT